MYNLTNELQNEINNVNGRRKRRILYQVDIEEFFELLNELSSDSSVHTLRVYSSDGFVANSYSYRAPISYLEANRLDDDTFSIGAHETDAKRSHGQGSLVTINGKAYDY